jgi:hypothetical protein
MKRQAFNERQPFAAAVGRPLLFCGAPPVRQIGVPVHVRVLAMEEGGAPFDGQHGLSRSQQPVWKDALAQEDGTNEFGLYNPFLIGEVLPRLLLGAAPLGTHLNPTTAKAQ